MNTKRSNETNGLGLEGVDISGHGRRVALLGAAVAIILAAQGPAAAQTPGGPPGKTGDWSFTLGAAGGYSPDYEGSDDYEASPLPIAEVSWRDVVFLGSASGPPELKVRAVKVRGPTPKDRLNVDVAVGYFFGRDEDDNAALDGLGDLDGGATARLSIDYQWQDFGARMSVGRDLSGDREGTTVTAGLRYGFALGAPKTRLTLGVSTTWADDNYMGNTFGVLSLQSTSSTLGYALYTAEAGIKDVGVDLSVMHFWNRNVAVVGRLGYKRLLGDAADSPLVDAQGSSTQFSALAGISYRW